jgi:hypothetical protein
MELLYLYLDDYNIFKKKGFCFSSEFEISIKQEKHKQLLTIRLNPDYIPNFFENPNILNAFAIIGQNGTGKSMLLEFIRNSLPDGAGGFDKECIVVLKSHPRDNIISNYIIYVTPNINLAINDETERFILKRLEKPKKRGYLKINHTIESLSDTIFINYSNIVDLKIPATITNMKIDLEDEQSSSTGFRNISTMAMLAKDQEDFLNSNGRSVDKVDAYKSREFGRNVEFMASEYRHLLDFELPNYLTVTLMDDDEKSFIRESKTFDWLFKLLKEYDKEFIQKTEDQKALFFLYFLRATFFNLIRTDLTSSSISLIPEYISKTKGKSFEDFFRTLLNKMKKTRPKGVSSSSLAEKSDAILKFVDFVYEYLIKTQEPRVLVDSDKLLALPVSFKGTFSIQNFIDRYVKAKSITDFLQFKWRSLSSGEQSMLTLISRFYRLSLELNQDDLHRDVVILLDEPDLYFHPEWQRTLLAKLLGYIPEILPNRKIQFIITANTPYLVSDLLPTNVILLRKEKGQLHVNTASTIKKTTFASNIHTLLSEDFYVSNFLGEFAKAKIEKLVRFIEKPQSVPEFEKQMILKTIRSIGEPIIRNRLIDMYRDKIGLPGNSVDEEKQRLENELRALNRIIDEEKSND